MKRNTDVSRMSSAGAAEPGAAGTRPAGRDAATERATALLALGLQQSAAPISELGAALARMARALDEAGAPLFDSPAAVPDRPAEADLRRLRAALARDVAVCIECLQFHDRLTQQLSQAHDLLSGGRTEGPLTKVSNRAANAGSPEGSIELF
jgi:hypothetical protein